jgi:hypothetical protein
MKRTDMPLVEVHGKEAINFQISVTIAFLVCVPLMFVLIGIPLMVLVGLGALILTVIAAVKISNGNLDYKYPFALRLLK